MPAWLIPLIAAAGSALGGAASGSAKEREAQNSAAATQDRARADIYGTQQSALANLLQMMESGALNRAQLGVSAPKERARQLAYGSILQNVQPFKVTPPSGSRVKIPTVSGGLNPSALSAMARAGGGELQRQGLLAMLTGSDVPKMPNYAQQGMLTPPELSKMKQAGKFESIAGAAGLGLGTLGSVMGQMQAAKAPTTVGTNNRLPAGTQTTISGTLDRTGMDPRWRLPQGTLQGGELNAGGGGTFTPQWQYGQRGVRLG